MASPVRHAGRFARNAGLVLASVVALAVVFVALVGVLPFGGRLVAATVAKLASNEERSVEISPPSGLLSGRLRVESIIVGDRAGPYAEISNLAVDWSPAALLRGAFRASLVSAESVALSRKPLPSEKPEEETDGFSLPVAVEIEKIAVPDLTLAEAVAGQPFSLAATGAVDAHRDAASLTLDIANREQKDARATANLVYAPAENRLTLEAALSEPPGGLVARLASLPGAPAVALALTGTGPLSDWRGRLTGKVDGAEVLALEGRHQLMSGGHAVTVKGGGTPENLLPPAFRPLFSGETRIDIAALLKDAGGLRIENGRVENRALTFTAAGTYDPTGGANDLKATLAGIDGPVDLRLPLEDGEARLLIRDFGLSLSGPASAATLAATAALDSATLPQGGFGNLELKASGDALDLTRRSGHLRAELTAASATFADENLARLVRAPLKLTLPLSLDGTAISIENGELESASVGGTFSARYGLAEKSATGDFRLFALPAVLPPELAARTGGTIAATGKLSIGNGAFALSALDLKSELVNATGEARLADSTLTADFRGTLPDLGKTLANASGTGDFTLTAEGPLAALGFSATLDMKNATLAGKVVESLSLAAKGKADRAAPTAELTLNGRLDGQTVEAAANLVSTAAGPQIPRLSLDAGPNRLTGALRFSPDFRPKEGTIRFDFPDVSLLAALAGQKASGALSGEAALVPKNGVTGLTVKAAGSVASAGASLEKLALDLSMADIATVAANGTLTALSAGTADATVRDLDLTVSHAGSSTNFTLGGRYDDAPLTLKGALAQQGGGALTVRLDAFSAAPKRIPVRLAAPTTIRVANGTAVLEGLRIATGSGSVTVNGSAGKTLNLTAALSALPASLANAFAPDLAAEGAISGEVKATGEAAAPSVAYRLDWANAATSQTRGAGLSPLTVNASGTFAGGRLGLETTVNGGGGLAISGGGSVETGAGKALSLAFRGRVPMAALQGRLTEQGIAAEGAADVDIAIAGTAAAPAVTGTVTLAGAKLVDLRRNLTLNALTGTIRFDGQQATISALNGRLGGGGTIGASGTIGITPGSGFPADIAIKLGGATYADGTLFTSSASGELALKGPLLQNPVLSGRLALSNTSITVPEKLPASLADIDIRHKNAPAAVKTQMREIRGEEENGSSSTIALDLAVSTTSSIFVRGRGIDAELGGDLTIRGTAADPIISGAYTMRRGRLTILSRRLDFSSGTITFGGALIPILNLEATSTASSTTITVEVTGAANDPNIVFSSSPALPQDEVIAQLIFNQSMSKLSALQIAQLADAVRQLAGGRSTSLFEALRSNLGVDDLDISTDEKGQAKVSAGKYLNERTYIQLEQGGTAGGKASINLDIGKGVKLRGEAGADGSGAAGIFYEREY